MSVDRRFRRIPPDRLGPLRQAADRFARALADGEQLEAAALAWHEAFDALPSPEARVAEDEWARYGAALPAAPRAAVAQFILEAPALAALRALPPPALADLLAAALHEGASIAQNVAEE